MTLKADIANRHVCDHITVLALSHYTYDYSDLGVTILLR